MTGTCAHPLHSHLPILEVGDKDGDEGLTDSIVDKRHDAYPWPPQIEFFAWEARVDDKMCLTSELIMYCMDMKETIQKVLYGLTKHFLTEKKNYLF